MRKVYAVFLLVQSFTLTGFAQPVINKLFDFQPGDEYVFRKLAAGQSLDTSMFQSIGSNLSWNMSALNLDPAIYRDTVLTPASSAYPASFPTATYVFKEHSGLQQYYRKRNDTIMYLGSNYGGSPSVLNPGGITIILPASYAASGNNIFPPTPTVVPGVGTWTYYGRYNAWGTLTLPGGVTVSNVGLYVVSGGDASIRFSDYIWAAAGKKDPVVRIQFRHQAGNTTVEHLYVSTSALNSSGIFTPGSKTSAALSVYPNPTAGLLRLSAARPINQVYFHDLAGRLVLESRQNIIETKDLAPGTYIITAICEDNTKAKATCVVNH